MAAQTTPVEQVSTKGLVAAMKLFHAPVTRGGMAFSCSLPSASTNRALRGGQGTLPLVLMLATVAMPTYAAPQGGPHREGYTAMLEIPAALKTEHEKLHEDLSAATNLAGKTGEAAKRVAAVLHEHFVSEEEFALPPLALLGPIAGDRATAEMRSIIALTDRLKTEMPRMLDEHKAIVRALDELGRAAAAERHPDVSRFVEELKAHAQMEEQVLYPAAILVGEWLKLKFPEGR